MKPICVLKEPARAQGGRKGKREVILNSRYLCKLFCFSRSGGKTPMQERAQGPCVLAFERRLRSRSERFLEEAN